MAVTERQIGLILHLVVAALFLHSFVGGAADFGFGRRVRGLVGAPLGMAIAAWLSAVSGTYLVYPWYRARPGEGESLAGYPQAWLLADPNLAQWHQFGMEWKEHVGWLAPILATAVAYVAIRHRRQLEREAQLQRVVATMFGLAFLAALAAGLLGAFLNKVAPNAFLAA